MGAEYGKMDEVSSWTYDLDQPSKKISMPLFISCFWADEGIIWTEPIKMNPALAWTRLIGYSRLDRELLRFKMSAGAKEGSFKRGKHRSRGITC